MHRTCVAVVDSTRARLFTFERTAEPAGLVDRFTETVDLVNPVRRRRPSELFSDSRPGTTGVSGGANSVGSAFDDHRDAHIDELDAEFSRAVRDALGELLRDSPAQRLILCASPHMLGALRQAGTVARDDLDIDEVPRDLAKLTPDQLRDQLIKYDLLPARAPRPTRATR